MGKSVLVGALVAILVTVVAAAGGYLYLRGSEGVGDEEQRARVVLVFESPAEDGAMVGALISLVEDGRMLDISPDTTVTIPGTTYHRLGDALVFGGGAAIASAVEDAGIGHPTAFVTVSESAWHSALATRSVQVDLSSDVTVFDGESLTTIRSGEQTLTAQGVGALLRGLPYVAEGDRAAIRTELERQLAAALATAKPTPDGVVSNLSSADLDSWLQTHLSTAVISRSQ